MQQFRKLLIVVITVLFASPIQSIYADTDPWSNPFGVVNPWPEVGQIGAGWCRCGGTATVLGSWNRIEKAAGQYDWKSADQELALIEKEGMAPLPILSYTPRWATRNNGSIHCPPSNMLDYYHFVRAFVTRYRGRIPAYEVWNEPNSRGMFFKGTPGDLATMIKVAACAIRQSDPDAKIVFPGLAGNDYEYLQRCYELGVGPYFDVMAVHPYQWSKYFNPTHRSVVNLKRIRSVMNENHDQGKPIWLTEFGWAVKKDTTVADQARLLVVGMTYMRSQAYLGIDRIFWYNSKSWKQQFGLFDSDAQKRPAFYAYQTLVNQLGTKQFIGNLPLENAEGFVFAANPTSDEVTVVLWAAGKQDVPVDLPLVNVPQYTLTTLEGQTSHVQSAHITASPTPVFLTIPRAAIKKIESAPATQSSPKQGINQDVEYRVWAQVQTPADTLYACVTPQQRSIRIQVWNLTSKVQDGEIRLAIPKLKWAQRQSYQVQPENHTTVEVPVLLPESTACDLYALRVDGVAGGKPIAGYTDRLRIAEGPTIEWQGNSYVETLYLVSGSGTPHGSPGMSWGNQWAYNFNLSGAAAAQLNLELGATHDNQWSVQLSTTGSQYTTIAEGRGGLRWRHINIPAEYLGGGLTYVRIRGKECQLRMGRIVVTPKPVTSQ